MIGELLAGDYDTPIPIFPPLQSMMELLYYTVSLYDERDVRGSEKRGGLKRMSMQALVTRIVLPEKLPMNKALETFTIEVRFSVMTLFRF